ncbi:hypothetical protein JOC37_001288 [Desulfohalotomaculum tongense]|nr:hypothetical protein [Desulforadius tongensis]
MKGIEKQLIITRLKRIKENGEEAFETYKDTGNSYAAKAGALLGSINALIKDIENGDYDIER